MSDVMLCGVLRMPPELWLNDPVARQQVISRMIEAAEQLEIRADEIERLRMLHATDLCELQRHLETARDVMQQLYDWAHGDTCAGSDLNQIIGAATEALAGGAEDMSKTDDWDDERTFVVMSDLQRIKDLEAALDESARLSEENSKEWRKAIGEVNERARTAEAALKTAREALGAIRDTHEYSKIEDMARAALAAMEPKT